MANKEADDLKNDWIPVWIPVVLNPWRLKNTITGAWLRKVDQKTEFNPAYIFSSVRKALIFLDSSKGRKAIKLQATIIAVRVRKPSTKSQRKESRP